MKAALDGIELPGVLAPRASRPRPIACRTCGIIHRLPEGHREALASQQDFEDRHAGHRLGLVLASDEAAHELYRGNADVKRAFAAEVALTVTALQSLANSATAGWGSASVDNTANLYLDALVQVVLDPANTVPGSSKTFYVFTYGGTNSSDLTTTGAASGGTPGSEGALTFPDVTANPMNLPMLGAIPYIAQDVVQKSKPMSVALHYGDILPPFWGVAVLNHSGAALAASGNTVKYRPVFATVIG